MKIKDIITEASGLLGAIGQGLGQAIAPQTTSDALRRQQAQAKSRKKNPHINDHRRQASFELTRVPEFLKQS